MNQSEGQTTHTHTQLPLTVSLVTREEQEEPKKIIYVRALVRYTHDVHEQKTIAVTRIHTHTCRDRQNHPPPFVCLMCRFSVFFLFLTFLFPLLAKGPRLRHHHVCSLFSFSPSSLHWSPLARSGSPTHFCLP